MYAETFAREVRERISAELRVQRDARFALTHGFHPDALQVWHVGPRGERYCVRWLVHPDGTPREPQEIDIQILQRSSFDRVHRGRRGYIDDQVRAHSADADQVESKIDAAVSEACREEAQPRAEHFTGQHRAYTVKHVGSE